ncbi:MAG: cytochrome b N-terminal domain-containing protein [Ferruginibacter sp.]
MLGMQIVTGIVLAMHYTPQVDLAFNSVELIKRDVNGGRILQAIARDRRLDVLLRRLYPHLPRSLSSAPTRRRARSCGSSACIIFLLMMATAFMGYVLPWGQMSFWAAAVITNIFAAIPIDRRSDPAAAARRLRGRQPDAQPLLLAALPAAVHHRGGGGAARLGAARAGQQQPDRRRREVEPRHACRSIRTTR